MLYELSKIVLPTSEFLDYTNLFFNLDQKRCIFSEKLTKVFAYKFNTWMNIFPAKKYHTYCNLDDLFLKINLNLNAQIMIFGFNYNEATQYDELLYKGKIIANEENIVQVNKFENYENIYFCVLTETDDLNIKAVWCTTTAPVRKNKLALITCTFKREAFVYKNIELFKQFIQENPELSERIKLYVVDNGKTIDKNAEDSNVKIFPNKNAGGAGGFTRGIIEAKNSNENFTRILLMDDDVEVFPESFARTLILSDYLKEEYRNSFIHGAMLNLYKKNMFFESTAIKNNNWCYSYHGELDITQQKNVASTNYTPVSIFSDEKKKASSAWWFCSFSMESVLNNGLPLPVFFRCDDLEWSWRNFGEHHITANGISVWHSPFEWRVSKPVEYYFSKRNIVMINILHTENYKSKMLKMLKRDFEYLLKTYDYTSCNLYLKMMNDISAGAVSYKKDPEILLKEVFEYIKQDIYEDIIDKAVVKHLKKKYIEFKNNPKLYKRSVVFCKILFKLTLNGNLLPKCFWKKERFVVSENLKKESFYFTCCVKVYNLLTNKFEIRIKNIKQEKELKNKFAQLYLEIRKNYKNIKQDFLNANEEFISENFWCKYLNLQVTSMENNNIKGEICIN